MISKQKFVLILVACCTSIGVLLWFNYELSKLGTALLLTESKLLSSNYELSVIKSRMAQFQSRITMPSGKTEFENPSNPDENPVAQILLLVQALAA